MNRRNFLASLFALPLTLKAKFFPAKELPILNPSVPPTVAVNARIDRLDLSRWGAAIDPTPRPNGFYAYEIFYITKDGTLVKPPVS